MNQKTPPGWRDVGAKPVKEMGWKGVYLYVLVCGKPWIPGGVVELTG